MDRDDRHIGDPALGQRGTRVYVAGWAWGRRPQRWVAWRPRVAQRWVAWRPWVVGRPTGGYWYRHRAVLGAILGGILETLCLWLPLCLPLWLCVPAGGRRPINPGLYPTLTPGLRSASSTSVLVLLRRCTGVLPLRAAMSRGMAGGSPHAAISPRLQVSAHIILHGYPPSRAAPGGFDIPPLGVDCGVA
jgi:hypothetical protein